MMKILGRIVSRGPKVEGLFMPMEGLQEGIFELREIMGECILVDIGSPAMKREKFMGIDLEGLLNERPLCCMTREELDKVD